MTFTVMSSPSLTTSEAFLTNLSSSWLTWQKPSSWARVPRCTGVEHPPHLALVNGAHLDLFHNGLDDLDGGVGGLLVHGNDIHGPRIVNVYLTPVLSMMLRITFPPGPMTSRILSGLIVIV